MDGLIESMDARGVATLLVNRPERHNAFDDALIAAMNTALPRLAAQANVRVLRIMGAGANFSAGADLDWMRRMAGADAAANQADAAQLQLLMQSLHDFPKPTLAVVQGAAYGGGVGLAACCDVVLAADNARFCFSEVRLGLIPAVIAPYVIAAIGARQARRYFTSAEVIPASRAREIGLVHEVMPADMLAAASESLVAAWLLGAPGAQAAAKDLVRLCAGRAPDAVLGQETARRIAERRATPEAREGIGAFLEKRKPHWQGSSDVP